MAAVKKLAVAKKVRVLCVIFQIEKIETSARRHRCEARMCKCAFVLVQLAALQTAKQNELDEFHSFFVSIKNIQ